MSDLFKGLAMPENPTNSNCLLTRNEVEEANKAVAKVQKECEESKILTHLFSGCSLLMYLLVDIHYGIHKVT